MSNFIHCHSPFLLLSDILKQLNKSSDYFLVLLGAIASIFCHPKDQLKPYTWNGPEKLQAGVEETIVVIRLVLETEFLANFSSLFNLAKS